MSEPLRIVPVDPGDALFTAFLDLPVRLGTQDHTPRASVLAELSRSNPFFSHGSAQAFVCLVADNVLGRIVASIDHHRSDTAGAGHFGYFESIDDKVVVGALLAAAETWLHKRGRTVIEGPVDLNIWTRYRVQTSGFDAVRYSGEPRSLPYYAHLLLAAGYCQRMEWRSYEFSVAELREICEYVTARRDSRIERGGAAAGLTCRRWNPEHRDLAELHEAIMASWINNYGFSYIGLPEFTRTFASFTRLFEPSWCFWFRDDSGAHAFGFGHRDPPEEASRAIIKAYGIAPSHRGTHLVYEIIRQLTWHAHAVARLPGILSLATERSDLWSRFKSPARTHVVLFKTLAH